MPRKFDWISCAPQCVEKITFWHGKRQQKQSCHQRTFQNYIRTRSSSWAECLKACVL
jgi:hypothetical protein